MNTTPLVVVSDVDEQPDAPGFLYGSVEDWFLNLLAPTLERRLDADGAGTLTWCPRWWAHAEAIVRLEALWRAWEVCRDADGEAPARWFWQHCDPMLAVLVDAKVGPLSDCKPDQHRWYTNAQTPCSPSPAGWCTPAASGACDYPTSGPGPSSSRRR